MPGPLAFEVKESPPTVMMVTGTDGQRYEVKIAVVVMGVNDTGITNPLDGMPIFNMASQAVVQITRVHNA